MWIFLHSTLYFSILWDGSFLIHISLFHFFLFVGVLGFFAGLSLFAGSDGDVELALSGFFFFEGWGKGGRG